MSEVTVLFCSGCERDFDSEGRPLEGHLFGATVLAWTCPDCERDQNALRAKARIAASGIPELPRERELVAADPPAAHAWARGEIAGVYVHGPVGAGKTWLAAACAVRRCEVEPVRWVSVPALIARLFTEDRQEAVRDITGTHCLVLDDLDKVKPSEWLIAQLFTAIDQRVNAGAGLLVTSNLPLAGIADRYGEAIASRLAGHCEVIELSGGDRRLAA